MQRDVTHSRPRPVTAAVDRGFLLRIAFRQRIKKALGRHGSQGGLGFRTGSESDWIVLDRASLPSRFRQIALHGVRVKHPC